MQARSKTKITMLSPTNLYDSARMRLEELRRIEKENEDALQKSPPGKIHIVKSQKRIQYYLRTDTSDKSGTYIRKKDEAKIRRYLQKSYNEKVQKIIQTEIKNIEAFLGTSETKQSHINATLNYPNTFNYKIRQICSNNPQEVKQYISPIDCSDEDYIKYWINIPFVKNPMPIQSTEYKTENGEFVRSKSELNIANQLLKNGIPYKYECQITLKNGAVAYPDFTILETRSRKQIYWEHRGMMDDREYAKNAVKKLKTYRQNGILLGKNLIITEETATNPLGTDEIATIIANLKNQRG